MRIIPLFCVVLLFGGCQIKKSPTDAGYPTTSSTLEISRDPTLLTTQQKRWAEMTLYGVRIGDSQSVLPKSQIREELNGGWIVMRNYNRYLSGNTDHIDALGVFETRLLDQLGITSEEDIAKKFGPGGIPIKVSAGDTIYYFNERHIRVVWNLVEKRVVAVNVWK